MCLILIRINIFGMLGVGTRGGGASVVYRKFNFDEVKNRRLLIEWREWLNRWS